MAVRNDFTAGEVLAAADLNDTFSSKQDDVLTTKGDLVTYGTAIARLGVGTNGQVLTADSAESLGIKWGEAPSGKILQVVRATDSTDRSTTSTSPVDVTGMSVTITPTKSTSAIIVLVNCVVDLSRASAGPVRGQLFITDASDNVLSGAERGRMGTSAADTSAIFTVAFFGYSTPATTSATTYKLRFASEGGAQTITVNSTNNTGEIYAIEVGA